MLCILIYRKLYIVIYRLHFFNKILKNSDINGSEELNQTLEFLEDIFGIEEESKLIPINSYYLMNVTYFDND